MNSKTTNLLELNNYKTENNMNVTLSGFLLYTEAINSSLVFLNGLTVYNPKIAVKKSFAIISWVKIDSLFINYYMNVQTYFFFLKKQLY